LAATNRLNRANSGQDGPIREAQGQGVEQENGRTTQQIKADTGCLDGEARTKKQAKGELGGCAKGSASELHQATIQ
jgi:hypothetical protein